MKEKGISVQDICMIGVLTAVISVMSWIRIPMPLGVPMTLQTFAVPLAGVILGPRKGMLAVVLYILLGAIGVPVFSGFSAGPGALFGLTGGFIWAFPLMALFAGLGVKKGTVLWITLGLLMGIVADYTVGVLQFMLVSGNSLQTSIMACVLPFLPTEAIKAALVGTVGMQCRRALVKNGLAPA